MYIEVWYRVSCNKCGRSNWVCDGDPNDCTGADVEGIECWHCHHKWSLNEEFEDPHEYDEDEEPPEIYCELGKNLQEVKIPESGVEIKS